MRFKDAFVEGYGSEVKEFALSPAEKDFRTSILKVSESGADVVAIIMFPEQGALFMKEYLTQQQNLPRLHLMQISNQASLTTREFSATWHLLMAQLSQRSTRKFQISSPSITRRASEQIQDFGLTSATMLSICDRDPFVRWSGVDQERQKGFFSGVGGAVEFDGVGVRKPQVEMVRIVDGKLPN
jgi:ABC-type branched-subunit amino acid transport system substrate-binding protein